MLNWLKQFNIFCFLDNQQYDAKWHQYECLVAAGSNKSLQGDFSNLSSLDDFIAEGKWCFGHINYDLGMSIEKLSSDKKNKIAFTEFHFFQPQILLIIKNGHVFIDASNAEDIYNNILQQPLAIEGKKTSTINIQQRLSKEQYIEKIKQLQAHIQYGDCYEINFCQEFFAEDADVDSFRIYNQLAQISPNPYSAFYRVDDKFLICASPERFIIKQGNKIFSQPMKGTAARDLINIEQDEKNKKELLSSAKERSENVMVVDLVRNDLSKISKEGTVKVDELFEICSYPQVHQMVSTVSGELKNSVSFTDIIKATFPMGSMTGAPKKRVMELIEEYEETARGIFSGTIGYLTPEGDFDLNVIIRSIMINDTKKYLSYQVGSGITIYSDPEKEWEECLLKAEAIKKVLTV